MTNDKPLVRLCNLKGLGLIIGHPSGVTYTNQTGGYACDHRELEGAFVPLSDNDIDQQADLDDHFFTGPKWRGHCYGGIDQETADFIDGVLAKSALTSMLKVDREKLAVSSEVWIYVVFSPTKNVASDDFENFPSGAGVLTWENSD